MKPISKFLSYNKIFIHTALLLLAVVLLVLVNQKSRQSTPTILLPMTFNGVYSQGGGTWQILDEHTKLNALDGELILKGNFEENQEFLEEGSPISFYLDYIMMKISVNGETVYGGYPYSEDLIRDLCSKVWTTWYTPALGAEDEIEIRLSNPYHFGNADAYNEFLRMIYPATEAKILSNFEKQTLPSWMTGYGMVICALVLFGIAVAELAQRHKGVDGVITGGLLVLFAGGFIMFDTLDISLCNPFYVMNSYGRQICLMLFVFELLVLTRYFLTGRAQMIANILTAVSALVNFGAFILALVTGRTLFGMMFPWMMIHALLIASMLVLCIWHVRKYGGESRRMLFGGCVLYPVMLLEIVNCYTCWWQDLSLMKIVFLLLLLVYIIHEIKQIARNYRAALREAKLAQELQESRVQLSLGQIRSHFIYNVLNAINYTGQHDSGKASEAVECFVRYLRSNVDVLQQNDKLIPFDQEMAHLRDYVALEKIHYDENIGFLEELQVRDFLMPPLVLQPLVENAIHHGFDKMERIGSITLRVTRSEDTVMIVVADDGAGFDQSKPMRDGAVGVENVRFRLKNMIDGTMEMKSRPGEGTRVIITMPYRPVESQE